MNHYELKQAARRQALKDRAEKLRSQAEQTGKEARQMADCIPFGQPILVGHHSEGRDRRFRGRITRKFQASIELSNRADELEHRAERVGRAGISSDDPEAVRKLQEKLDALEARQDLMKRVNRAHAAYLKNPASLDKANLSEDRKAMIRNYKPAYSWEPHPFAPFELTNNNATIRQTKARIESLKKAAAEAARIEEETGEPAKVQEFDGFTVREDFTENRVMFEFPGKPAEDVRGILKRNGFKWSPFRGAWVRNLNANGRWAASQVVKALTAPKA